MSESSREGRQEQFSLYKLQELVQMHDEPLKSTLSWWVWWLQEDGWFHLEHLTHCVNEFFAPEWVSASRQRRNVIIINTDIILVTRFALNSRRCSARVTEWLSGVSTVFLRTTPMGPVHIKPINSYLLREEEFFSHRLLRVAPSHSARASSWNICLGLLHFVNLPAAHFALTFPITAPLGVNFSLRATTTKKKRAADAVEHLSRSRL